ncbi:uncharacterized protein LOC130779843 isoform X4 [Actinidia eriantha]|uniref:uncharacterized protein LOC130779843 isoform X4 n=1 Tax=Actinidia eriantha TaxID=165200 RepID=UPI00258E21F0|nr:uncharacterized protein LOC130779843 isoform X4 [Actinidia eriantha]
MSPARKSAKIRHRRRPRGGREHRETAKQISRKRRMTAIGCTLPEHSMEAEVVSKVDLLTEILLYVPDLLERSNPLDESSEQSFSI